MQKMIGSRSFSKADFVYKNLLKRFRNGDYKFGDEIFATRIAEEFKVSRQPVMTALVRLQSEGFIIIHPQVNCRVVEPSFQELLDFFEFFAASEGLLARFAAERGTEEQFQRLRKIVGRLLEVSVTLHHLPKSYGRRAREFHAYVHSISGSTQVARVVEGLWGLADFYIWNGAMNVESEDIEQENLDRLRIVDAIASHKGKEAETMMREHVRRKVYRFHIFES